MPVPSAKYAFVSCSAKKAPMPQLAVERDQVGCCADAQGCFAEEANMLLSVVPQVLVGRVDSSVLMCCLCSGDH
ncbi:hypothetical protein SDC9_159987 [bioreactor metagenome]|uniref:Uncharacterized protein n=1 Tax=bioreactor metagenome TaxID=1076179 RepID=A0A645FE46_9ZZZZ